MDKILFIAPCPTIDDLHSNNAYGGFNGWLSKRLFEQAQLDFEKCTIIFFHPNPAPGNLEKNLLGMDMSAEREALKLKINDIKPNLLVLFGPIALELVTGLRGIDSYRGVILNAPDYNCKCLATYSPDHVGNNYSDRFTVISDLRKAVAESQYPEIRRTNRKVYVPESVNDVRQWLQERLAIEDTEGRKIHHTCCIDVETTALAQVDSISLSFTPDECLVFQFFAPGQEKWTLEEEQDLWIEIAKICMDKSITKLFHNSPYDLSYLHHYGILCRGPVEDTMFLHHAMQPELPKALGFLGSIYLSESSWKVLRRKPKADSNKKDE